MWNTIVSSKPNDWFDEGAQELLAIMVKEITEAHDIEDEFAKARKLKAVNIVDHMRKARVLKSIETRLGLKRSAIKTSAVKLRLTVQAGIDRRSRKLDERGTGRGKKRDPLLGGAAMLNGYDSRKRAN